MPRSDEYAVAPPPGTRYVSTAQVADALGVSVTTVKRWVDGGVLPAHRTPGGHRKLTTADVLRLVRDSDLPRADLARLAPGAAAEAADPAALADRLGSAVRAGDADLIRAVIHGGYRAGVPVETLVDAVIAPALARLGHDWASGRADILAEHRVTQACVAALYELRAALRVHAARGRPVALGGAPEHDYYVLPTLCAKLTLLGGGWDAVNLGPHTPYAAFAAAVEQLAPRLVWLSVSDVRDAEAFLGDARRLAEVCQARGAALVVGGSALTPALRQQMSGAAFGDGMTQLAAFARSLHRRRGRPRRGRPPARATPA